MKQLIKIEATQDGNNRVSARELYQQLGYHRSNFARWAQKQITSHPYAVEGRDWVGIVTYDEGNEIADYMLSIDFAKKVCMLSKTVVGEKVRNYFLAVEQLALVQTQQLQPTKAQSLNDYEDRLRRLEARTTTSGVDHFTVWGYSNYCRKRVCGNEASTLGKRASKRCRELGLPIETVRDPRFGLVNTYPETVLLDVFTEFYKQPRF